MECEDFVLDLTTYYLLLTTHLSRCCNNTCALYHNDGSCDDGGPGAEYSLCGPGSDCSDCGSRCYLSPVPATPYIHSAWPQLLENTGGSFPDLNFSYRGAIYHGAWTFSFVLRGWVRRIGSNPPHPCELMLILCLGMPYVQPLLLRHAPYVQPLLLRHALCSAPLLGSACSRLTGFISQ